MKNTALLAASAMALSLLLAPMPAAAQHAGHETHLPAPAKKPAAKKPAAKKPVKKKAVAKKPVKKKAAAKKAVATKAPPPAAVEPAHQHVEPVAPVSPAPAPAPVVDHSAHVGHGAPAAEPAAMALHSGHGSLGGALGPYPMNREASGTAWQPDTSAHSGLTATRGDWTLMGHGVLSLVYDRQGGRRGGDKLFAAGMLMGMARPAARQWHAAV